MVAVNQSALVAAILVGAASGAWATPTVPPASFLHFPVNSVAQLTQQVASDQTVQDHLAQHFHLSGPAMCAYVRDNMVLKTLDASSPYHVTCISPQAREYQVSRVLPVGTPVFTDRDTGRPILLAVSGDPLTDTLSPARSGGGAGGGGAAAAAAGGLGLLGLFARSGGSGSSGGSSAAASPSAPVSATADAAPHVLAQRSMDMVPSQVVFTQFSASPASDPSGASPSPTPFAEGLSGDEQTTSSTASMVLGPAATGTDKSLSGLLLTPAISPKARPSREPLSAAPEPSPSLTFTFASMLLVGLGLRKRTA